MSKFFLFATALFGFLAVALGAFATHALEKHWDAYFLKVFQTGVTYQFYHALAVGFIGILLAKGDANLLRYSGYCFLAGIFFFSGSLYLLTFTRAKMWGAVTPIGGILFLIGWALMGASFIFEGGET